MTDKVYKNIEIHLMGSNGKTPDYIIPVREDNRGLGYHVLWVEDRIQKAGEMGFFEVAKDLYIPLHRIAFVRISDPLG